MNFVRLFFSQSLIGLALLNVAVLAQSATAETIIWRSRNVQAELSYDKPEEFKYKNVRLKIVRAGKTVLEQQIQSESDSDRPIGSLFEENKLPIADLDGDKEPEVIVDFFTGGAHCCTYSLIYRYDKQGRYTNVRHEWGNDAYRLKGFLAAYLACKYLLGQEEDGWRRVEQADRESDRAQFFSNLRNFLAKAAIFALFNKLFTPAESAAPAL